MGDSITIFLLYKIMSKKYIDDFANGNFHFSCCKSWINIAKNSHNNFQGDKYEGVFAKYKKENSGKPLQHYKALFKKDLIIENEGEFILLRRKSSLKVPAICFYSLDSQNIYDYLPDNEKNRIDKILKGNSDKPICKIPDFPITISPKYLSEFEINSDLIECVTIQPGRVAEEFKENNIFYEKVTYIDMSNEFDIFKDELYKRYFSNVNDAIDNHIEIFFKDENKYAYQCELRAVLPKGSIKNITKGRDIQINGLSKYYAISPLSDLGDIAGTGSDSSAAQAKNITGTDIICYTKNINMKVTLTLENKHI